MDSMNGFEVDGRRISVEPAHANGEGVSRVKIRGVARPLPILGAFVSAFAAGESQGNVAIEVEVLYA